MRAERFKCVSMLDEDLDMDIDVRIRYGKTRDYDLVKVKPAGKPVVYHVREVPHGLFDEYVDAPDAASEKYRRAFICGIEKVENLPQLDGVTLGTWAPTTINTRTSAIILDDDDLRLFSPAERAEIGAVIYTHSFLPRRIAATYLLLPSLHAPMTALELRLAESSQKSAAGRSKGKPSVPSIPSQAGTDKTSSTAAERSDDRMAVTATVINP